MPSNSLKQRRPLDLGSAHIPRGQVHVIPERCKQCGYCIQYCPTQVLVYSDGFNAKGYHYPEVAPDKAAACVNCRFCDLICPELAIFTTDDESSGSPAESADVR